MRATKLEFDPAVGHPGRWRILSITCTCLILVVAGVSGLNIAIPSIIDELEPSNTETLWIVDGYALVFAGLLLPAGALGDKFGRKGALLLGLAIFTLGALLSSWAGDPTQLIVARGIMGLGAAFIMPATLSIIMSVFPPSERSKAIAIWAGFAGGGAAIGVITGGVLLEKFWWGSVFLINVPIAAVAGILVVTMVPTSRDAHNAPLDGIGAVLSIAGLGSLVYAIIEGGEVGWSQGSTIAWFAAAAVSLACFIAWELSTSDPMLDPRLFRLAPFSIGSLALVSSFAVMFGMFFTLTQFFQLVQNLSPLRAAIRLVPFALTMIVASPFSPLVAKRLGKRGVIAAGLTLQAVGFAWMATIDPGTAYGNILVGQILLAVGMAWLMPAGSEAILSSVPPSKAGVGSAWNDSTREIGGALGIAVMGTLLATGYRSGVEDATAALPPELAEQANDGIGGALSVAREAGLPELIEPAQQAFVDGMALAFWTSAVVGLVAAAIVLLRYPRRDAEPEAAIDTDVVV